TNLDSVITTWNEGAERLYGYTAEEMVGSRVTRLHPPDLKGEEARILARIRKGERVEHVESRRVAKGNRIIDVSISISPIRDAEGTIVGISRIARDITQVKVQEKNVARERAFSDAMLNSMPGILYLYDTSGRF